MTNPIESLESRLLFSAGHYDPTFNHNGITDIPKVLESSRPLALVTQSDGKILLALAPDFTHVAIIRYTTHGRYDRTFGTNGVLTIANDEDVVQSQMSFIPTPLGNLLVEVPTDLQTTQLLKFTAAGAPDSSFGVDGVESLHFQPTTAILPSSSDALLFATNFNNQIEFISLNSDGRYNRAFGNQGILLAQSSSINPAKIVQLHDNSFILAGDPFPPSSADNSGNDLTLATPFLHYNTNLTLDSSYGTQGETDVSYTFDRTDATDQDFYNVNPTTGAVQVIDALVTKADSLDAHGHDASTTIPDNQRNTNTFTIDPQNPATGAVFGSTIILTFPGAIMTRSSDGATLDTSTFPQGTLLLPRFQSFSNPLQVGSHLYFLGAYGPQDVLKLIRLQG